jgi:hypothetical protein
VDNVAWKTDLPGRSWSSPIVWGDRVFLTAVVNVGQSEPPKKGLYMGGERLLPPKSEHLWKVLCLDLATGKMLWEKTVHQGVPNSHPSQKQLWRRNARDGWPACLRPVRQPGRLALTLDGEGFGPAHRAAPTAFGWAAASPVHDSRLFLVNDNQERRTDRPRCHHRQGTLRSIATKEHLGYPFV